MSIEPIATIKSRIISDDHCVAATAASAPRLEKTSRTSKAETEKEASVTEARLESIGSRISSPSGTRGSRRSITSSSSRLGSATKVAPIATVARSFKGESETCWR